jgi:hypothetical protein
MPIETTSVILSDGSIRLRKIDRPEESFADRLRREGDALAKAISDFNNSAQALADYTRTLKSAAAEEDRTLNFAHSTPAEIERVCATHKHAKFAYLAQDAATQKSSEILDDALVAFHTDLTRFQIDEMERTSETIDRDIRVAARWPADLSPASRSALAFVRKWSVPLTELSLLAPPPLSVIRGAPGYFKRGSRGAVPLARRLLEQYRQLLEVKL